MLVVEDDREVRTLLRLVLQLEAVEVVEAADGQQALERIAAEPFDLVLLDLLMPRVHGLEVLRKIRGGGRNARIPVVIVTSEAQESEKRRGYELGASTYVVKPFDVQLLLEQIRRYLHAVEAA